MDADRTTLSPRSDGRTTPEAGGGARTGSASPADPPRCGCCGKAIPAERFVSRMTRVVRYCSGECRRRAEYDRHLARLGRVRTRTAAPVACPASKVCEICGRVYRPGRRNVTKYRLSHTCSRACGAKWRGLRQREARRLSAASVATAPEAASRGTTVPDEAEYLPTPEEIEAAKAQIRAEREAYRLALWQRFDAARESAKRRMNLARLGLAMEA